MSAEVRTEDGELVGWIDSIPPEQKVIQIATNDRWLGREPLSDPGALIVKIQIHRRVMRSEPWHVTPDHLKELRRTSIFRPLITREMMVEAAKVAAANAIHRYQGDEWTDQCAGEAVDEVLANLIEPL